MIVVSPTERAMSLEKAAREQNRDRLVGAQTPAAHLTMSRATVRYFTERGFFVRKSADGGAGFNIDECRDKYIAHLRTDIASHRALAYEAFPKAKIYLEGSQDRPLSARAHHHGGVHPLRRQHTGPVLDLTRVATGTDEALSLVEEAERNDRH